MRFLFLTLAASITLAACDSFEDPAVDQDEPTLTCPEGQMVQTTVSKTGVLERCV